MKTKTRYCKYYDMCYKKINCFKGEYCSVFEHTSDFTSLRFDTEDRSKIERSIPSESLE